VVIQCCPENSALHTLLATQSPSTRKRLTYARRVRDLLDRHPDSFVRVKAVSEPALCQYRLYVCADVMCLPKDMPGELARVLQSQVDKAQPPLTHESPEEVVRSILPMCMQRSEEWWTYELCFAKEVKQFHVDASVSIDSSGRRVEQREVFLAHLSPCPCIVLVCSPTLNSHSHSRRT
jgi:hypothetical protein